LLQAAGGPVADGIELFVATSGTQGEPKAVMLSGANLQAGVLASRSRLPLQAGDAWLACLPLYHIGGMAILYRCAEAGAAVVLHESFDPQRVWNDLEKYRITHISLVPAMLARLLDNCSDSPPPALKVALIGGGPLSAALAERARDAGWPVCASYGMSETGSQVATLCDMPQGWAPGQVGSPLPGFEVEVVGEDGRPTSGIGRIRIRGAAVMAGYANPQRQTGLGLAQGWFASGDLGFLDMHGNLTVLGRHDDMLVSGGTNVHPQQVEEVLKRCQGVADAALTSVADDVWGDFLVAAMVADADDAALEKWCRNELSGAMRPRRFVRLPALPRNALGKLDRQALRDLVRQKLE
ncbi:MAG: AMP-binding protein, partial [Sulfuricella sp.]|nr:AMP-binding protein [Sulfuricella sp.]